jgi:hypothetical protein
MFLFLDVVPNKLVFQPSCLSPRKFSILDLGRVTDCELITAINTRDDHHEHNIQLLFRGMAYTFRSAGCSYHAGPRDKHLSCGSVRVKSKFPM